MVFIREITSYMLDVERVQEVKLDRGGTEPAGKYIIYMDTVLRIMNYIKISLV
jgi:hypothetical protein